MQRNNHVMGNYGLKYESKMISAGIYCVELEMLEIVSNDFLASSLTADYVHSIA